MAAETVRLEEGARRVLRNALRKELPKGSTSLEGRDEILVLVLGPDGGLVRRMVVRGRPVDMRELGLRLAGAEAAVESLAGEPTVTSPPLTAAEAAVLDETGLVASDEGRPRAFEKSRIEFDLLVQESLSLDKAAKRLGVHPSRLRQRLAERTLYGIKDGRSWRIPTFQFDAKRRKLVRGIEKVLPHVRAEAHPLAVVAWFSTPHQDLVAGEDEESVSPLQWLAMGAPVDAVAQLAGEI